MPHSLVLSHPFRGRKEWELRKSSHDRLCSNFAGCTMTFVRSMGRWTMTALVINCIIGGGIFGLPGELTRLLGQASPFAMIFAALGMALILACFSEVASQFSEPGGAYLYIRTAFGGFAGMQIGWFDLLNVIGTVAALANLFVPRAILSRYAQHLEPCSSDGNFDCRSCCGELSRSPQWR